MQNTKFNTPADQQMCCHTYIQTVDQNKIDIIMLQMYMLKIKSRDSFKTILAMINSHLLQMQLWQLDKICGEWILSAQHAEPVNVAAHLI